MLPHQETETVRSPKTQYTIPYLTKEDYLEDMSCDFFLFIDGCDKFLVKSVHYDSNNSKRKTNLKRFRTELVVDNIFNNIDLA